MTNHSPTLPVAVGGLVPHRRPMLILDELRECGPESATGAMVAQPGNPYVLPGGTLEAAVYPEAVAQLFAACSGYLHREDSPRSGYLVGISDFRIARQARIGEQLLVEIRTGPMIAGVAMVSGSVRIGDEQVAEGEIKVFIGARASSPRVETSFRDCAGRDARAPVNVRECIQASTVVSGDATFCFSTDAPVFAGHFPGKPILPGAVLIAAAQWTCEKLLARPLNLRKIEWAKFSSPILPDETMRLEVKPQKGSQLARFFKDGRAVASMMLQMGEAV